MDLQVKRHEKHHWSWWKDSMLVLVEAVLPGWAWSPRLRHPGEGVWGYRLQVILSIPPVISICLSHQSETYVQNTTVLISHKKIPNVPLIKSLVSPKEWLDRWMDCCWMDGSMDGHFVSITFSVQCSQQQRRLICKWLQVKPATISLSILN